MLGTNDLDSRPLIHHNRLSARYPRQIVGTTSPRDDVCKPFEEGDDDNQEFYSPGWPGPYPNYTECVRVLEGNIFTITKQLSLFYNAK